MGFRLRGAAQQCSARPFLTVSCQPPERSPAVSWPRRSGSDSGCAVGRAAGRRSRSRSGRCPRCWPVVRFFQRTVLLEVGEDGANGGGLLDTGDDPHRATAMHAGGDIDVENTLEPLRPEPAPDLIRGHRASALFGTAWLVIGADVHRRGFARKPLAPPRRRQLRAQGGGRGKHAVEAGEMRAWWRDQRGQLGDKVDRVPFDMRGAIRPLRGNAAVLAPPSLAALARSATVS